MPESSHVRSKLQSLVQELTDSKLLNMEASLRDVLRPDIIKQIEDDDGVVVANNNYVLVVKPVPPPPPTDPEELVNEFRTFLIGRRT